MVVRLLRGVRAILLLWSRLSHAAENPYTSALPVLQCSLNSILHPHASALLRFKTNPSVAPRRNTRKPRTMPSSELDRGDIAFSRRTSQQSRHRRRKPDRHRSTLIGHRPTCPPFVPTLALHEARRPVQFGRNSIPLVVVASSARKLIAIADYDDSTR